MNNEVESYRNDELVSILNAFPDRTKILINGSADFEIRHSWNNDQYCYKRKRPLELALVNGQSLNTDLIICVCILTHRKENVKCSDTLMLIKR